MTLKAQILITEKASFEGQQKDAITSKKAKKQQLTLPLTKES